MKRLLQKLIAASLVTVLLAGCATTGAAPGQQASSSDATRTKMEGAGLGGILLGTVGAIVGYQQNGAKGAVIGGLAGLAAGAALGYVAGSTVAARKQQYANAEARLDGEIRVVAGYNEQLKSINQRTAARINELDREILALKSRYQKGGAQVADLKRKQEEIRNLMDLNTKTKESMTAELVALTEYQRSLGQTGGQAKVAQLRQEITALQQNVAILDNSNRQMAQLVESLTVRT